jgi:hypothetical protein
MKSDTRPKYLKNVRSDPSPGAETSRVEAVNQPRAGLKASSRLSTRPLVVKRAMLTVTSNGSVSAAMNVWFRSMP